MPLKVERHSDETLVILRVSPAGAVNAHFTIAYSDIDALVDQLLHADWLRGQRQDPVCGLCDGPFCRQCGHCHPCVGLPDASCFPPREQRVGEEVV